MHIPSQHYVGIISRENDNYPLGFMTEDGTDSAATKRKATVDQWTSSNSGASSFIIKNEPLSGFILTDGICERHRSGVRTKWRIEDPRGFELEINWVNLEYIMRNSVIDKGEILADCIWGREKGDNYLLVKGTPEYEEAMSHLDQPKKSISIKELTLGDNVLFKNGETGIFLGKVKDKLYFNKKDYVYKVKKPTIISHLGKKDITPVDAEKFIIKNSYRPEFLSGINKTEDTIVENDNNDSFYGNLYSVYNGEIVFHRGRMFGPQVTVYFNDMVMRKSHSFWNNNQYYDHRSEQVPISSLSSSYYKKRVITTNLGNTYEKCHELTYEEFKEFVSSRSTGITR